MDRGRLPDPRSKASIAPTRPRREVKKCWLALLASCCTCLYLPLHGLTPLLIPDPARFRDVQPPRKPCRGRVMFAGFLPPEPYEISHHKVSPSWPRGL